MKKITLLFALFACLGMQAQWTVDTAANTLVADSVTDDAGSVGTTDGRTFVVFWKVVAEPVNYELRVQLLDAAGNKQFGADGMLISDAIPMDTFTYVWKLAIDNNNNLYVSVTGSGAGNPAYVFKIDTSGASLWANGLNLGTGFLPTVLPLSNGEVAIALWPGSQRSKLQKYTADGTAIWANPVLITGTTPTSGTTPADLFEMSNHDIMVVFHQKLGFGTSSNLYAQKFSSDGNQVWASATQLSDKGTAYNATYSRSQDGDVVYYGYSGATGLRYDSYVQRLNADGTIPWGINGIDFDTNTTTYEMDTKIACAQGSPYVWAIARYTPATQDVYGEYVQKFDKITGARQFTDNAKEVFAPDATSQTHISNLFLQDDNPLFLIVTGPIDPFSPVTLSAVRLDAAGDQAWDEPLPVATFAASKGRVALNKPVNGQAVVVFVESKIMGQNKIYAQNFSTSVLGVNGFEAAANDIRLYPNPANGIFNISGNMASVRIYNSNGQLVYENKTSGAFETAIDSGKWSKGIYLVNAVTAEGIQKTLKFVKTN